MDWGYSLLGMSRNANVTVREGMSEKNWQYLAGYVAIGVLTLIITGIAAFQGAITAVGPVIGILLLVIFVGAFGTYITLFQDAAYIRDTRGRWNPQWWYYIIGGIGTPIVVYLLGQQIIQDIILSATLGMIAHAISASVMSAVYLYNRHKHIGVP